MDQNKSKSKETIDPDSEKKLDSNNTNIKSKSAVMILYIGLSVHNILEGVSIGLSPSKEKLILIMIGVCTHKLIDSFFLGMMFLRANWVDTNSHIIMCLFCLTGPSGVLIGFLMHDGAPLIAQAIMTSLTTGTFL